MTMSLCVALIGYGGIAKIVLREVRHDPAVKILNVLVREPRLASVAAELPEGTTAITRIEQLDPAVSVVIEAAGQAAVAQYGSAVLSGGRDLAVASAGALADDFLLGHLSMLTAQSSRRLQIVSGAVGGLDALASAKSAGLHSVSYTGIKPALAWVGTPAERDLQTAKTRQVIFRGNAREAARIFPKNANVAATIALVGIGFDQTSVTLIADPSAQQNAHIIEAEGAAGSLRCELRLNAVEGNPKTSLITAYSVVQYLRTGCAALNITAPLQGGAQ